MPSSYDLILKNGKCFIDGQLKIVDIGISEGIIKSIGKIEENTVELLLTFSISLVTIFCKKSFASSPATCMNPLSSRVITSFFFIFASFESIIY